MSGRRRRRRVGEEGEGRGRGRRGTEGGEWEGKKGRERREVCVNQSQKEHIHVYLPVYI